ncbi:hypothetical protein PHYPSEUDO_003363 [Phytophthora pseudosyringae]|uniref:Peptidase S1 domain-containing protein n=1 Tax=Phytophthora pseudosyringae TaxID=221518 RepID=A0A8T1VU36_9STRA|nr:hypothetical protein PHYPSEUDO_003363 [Phytophthora pseudosyringae]
MKTYTAVILSTVDGDSFCGGSLVSPTHVLTKTPTRRRTSCRWTRTTSTARADQGRVGPEPHGIEHVQRRLILCSADSGEAQQVRAYQASKTDDLDIIPGMWPKAMGWATTASRTAPPRTSCKVSALRSLCSGDVANKDASMTDTGGPLIKEKDPGDADDILLGLVNWGYGCDDAGSPTVYSRVTAAIQRINSITSAKRSS